MRPPDWSRRHSFSDAEVRLSRESGTRICRHRRHRWFRAVIRCARPHVGDTVMAFGNPFDLNFTVTRGTVSALGRSQFRIEPLQDFIQTDAVINPGNSGGALVDVKGQMVGINTAILSGNSGPGGEGGFIGIGFAIPINMAKRTMEALIKTGKVTRGYLGVVTGPVTQELAREFNVPDTSGAFVQDVTRGAPAEKAGLKPGDVIRKFEG